MKANEAALATKVKAKFAKHLTLKQYDELLSKESLADIATYLRNSTYYGEYLTNITDDNIHRGQLEEIIRDSVFLRFRTLLQYVPDTTGDFFKYQILLNECKQIVSYFRAMNQQDKSSQIAFTSYQLSRYSKVPFNLLLKATSYSEFTQALIGTPYYKIFSRYAPQEGEVFNFTSLEVALNKFYFQEVKKLIGSHFSGTEASELNRIFDTHIEIENLTRIYRMKKYFDSKPSVIKASISPYYALIKKAQLEQMIDKLNADEFVNEIKRTAYAKYIEDEPFVHIENYMERMMYNVSKHYLNFSSSAAVILVCYMELTELEVINIIEIIEGIRYNVDRNKIKELIIHYGR